MNGLALGLTMTAVLLPPRASAANAQPSSSTLEYGVWAQGVSPADQRTAMALFQEGNTLMDASAFVKAIEKYQQALEHWKHPAIHYNLALALMNLNQPTELYEQLEAATRHGPTPLDSEKYKHALGYKALLEKQLTWLEVTCDKAGATVTLDGRPLFVAPGRFKGLVHPGMHSLVAVKPGYVFVDKSQTLNLKPGEQVKLDLKLYTEDEVTRYRKRWPAWIPWAVMGSGLAVAAGGGLLYQQASENYGVFSSGITECGGCRPEPGLADIRTRGDTLQTAAFGAYALGGTALITGTVLFILNRTQPYRIDPTTGEELQISPLVGGTNGVQATLRF